MIPVMRPWLGAEEAAAAAEAVASGWIAQGPRVAEFEAAFAEATGSGHAVAVSSCTAALHLALIAAGIGPGDEVMVPSLSFIATANAARYVGAEPVFADVDLGDAEPESRRRSSRGLTERTRAVILVDQAGVPADLDAMRALCDPRGIAVDRGRGLRGRVGLPRAARRSGRQPRGVLLPPPQAAHHRRRGHDHHSRRRPAASAAPLARAWHGRQRGRSGMPAASR